MQTQTQERIGEVDLFATSIGQRFVAGVRDDANHLDPFGLWRA
jgi:hypothetical protein